MTDRVTPEEIERQRELGWPDFHPEDYCHRCGARNMLWYADRETWNAVTADWAAETGLGGSWRLSHESSAVSGAVAALARVRQVAEGWARYDEACQRGMGSQDPHRPRMYWAVAARRILSVINVERP